MSNYVQINHDGFARMFLMRETVHGGGVCQWCGQRGMETKQGNRQFMYGWQSEGQNYNYSRVRWSGPYCSVDCFRCGEAL